MAGRTLGAGAADERAAQRATELPLDEACLIAASAPRFPLHDLADIAVYALPARYRESHGIAAAPGVACSSPEGRSAPNGGASIARGCYTLPTPRQPGDPCDSNTGRSSAPPSSPC